MCTYTYTYVHLYIHKYANIFISIQSTMQFSKPAHMQKFLYMCLQDRELNIENIC